VTRRNEPWPEIPGEAERRRQEAEDKRAMDELEELLTPPLSDLDHLALEEADRLEQSWRRRNGLEPSSSAFRSSAELREIGKARGWDHESRAAYLAAYDREDAIRKANRSSIRGAA